MKVVLEGSCKLICECNLFCGVRSDRLRAMGTASKHVRISKIFSELECRDFYHPWTPSCIVAMWGISLRSLKGSMQFYAAMYVLELILNRRKANREYLVHLMKNYMRSVIFGYLTSIATFAFSCTFRTLFGKFHRYTIVFLPAMISGFSIFIERRKKQELYTCTLVTMTIEYVIRHMVRAEVFQLTKLKLCASFMLLNAAIMYLFRSDRPEDYSKEIKYWFFIPSQAEKRRDKTTFEIPVCHHTGSCWSHGLQEATKYLGLGVAIQILRILLPQFRKIFLRPSQILRKICVRKNFSLGLFFGGYVTIYNAVSCLLCQYRGRDSQVHSVPAGFLAGAAFWFDPKLTTLIMAGTTILQQLTWRGIAAGVVPRSALLSRSTFAVLYGVLSHCRLVDIDLCHPLFRNIISKISDGLSEEAQAVYMKLHNHQNP